MIANAVARAEIVMRVVIERAPADAAANRVIRSGAALHAGVAQRVFDKPLFLIKAFRRVHVAVEFRDKIRHEPIQPRDFSLVAQRDLPAVVGEVVHCIDIFQQFALRDVADAAGLPRGVEFMRDAVGFGVKIVIVLRFVDAHAPEDD